MPCEAENPNVPVVLGLAYDPDMHSCNWPDLLIDRGCDPSERLGGFKCPSLRGQLTFLWKQIVIKTFLDIEGTFNERFSPFPRFAGSVFISSINLWIMKMIFSVSDPRVYIICVDGQPRLQSCGAHDQFDKENLTCVRRPPSLFYYRK